MITVEYTPEQLEAQLQLNHVAVLARGMEVAEASVVLCKLMIEARERANTIQGNGADTMPDVVTGGGRS